MDLYAYSQIEILDGILKDLNIEIRRLRGLRLMKDEKAVSSEKIEKIINDNKLYAVKQWLQQKCWDGWSSTRDNRTHPALKMVKEKVECGDEVWFELKPVSYDFSKIHGKDRKALKFRFKQIEREVKSQMELFNKYIGTNTLYVHARQGGGNRYYYGMVELVKNPRYLADVDDCFDGTYCDIYFDLSDANIDKYIEALTDAKR